MVRLAGIEPALPAPEADALSTELQARRSLEKYTIFTRRCLDLTHEIKGVTHF